MRLIKRSCVNVETFKSLSLFILSLVTASAIPYSLNIPSQSSCVNWNQYYTNCTQLGNNPFQGTISFDNIGLAWVAIFLVISLEGKIKLFCKLVHWKSFVCEHITANEVK